MRVINKIEEAVNKAIYALLKFLMSITPSKLKLIKAQLEIAAQAQREKIQAKIHQSKDAIKIKARETKVQLITGAKTLYRRGNESKEELAQQVALLKQLGPMGVIKKIPGKVKAIGSRWQKKIDELSSEKIIGGIGISLFVTILVLFITMETKTIDFEFTPNKVLLARNPAGSEVVVSKDANLERPPYYKLNLRQIRLDGIQFPVFIQSEPNPRYVAVDLVVDVSSRYATKYLINKEIELRDFFLRKIHPVVPSFPLAAEGKEVIRTKIINEINAFLQEMSINGEAMDVHIHSITVI